MTKNMAGTVIYKKTQTGAIQSWEQQINHGAYRTVSGQIGGKLTASDWTECEITNSGRANMRGRGEQAIFEVNANYKKKLDRDYHLTIEEARAGGSHIFEPMLAYDFDKVKPKNYPKFPDVYMQPKLDGMRCIATATDLFTRTGDRIVSCPHIVEELAPLFQDDPDLILDGELYNHDLKDNFDEVMSIFKRTKPTKEDFKKAREYGQYHIYDIPSVDANFGIRSKALEAVFAHWLDDVEDCCVQRVHTYQTPSIENVKILYADFRRGGYEGGVIRSNTPYENKRTWALIKYVEFLTAEFKLLSIHPGKGNWAGKARYAWLEVKTKTGIKKFKADIVGTMGYCAKVLADQAKYIGKDTTVRFRNYTPKGIPRFGKIKELDRRG